MSKNELTFGTRLTFVGGNNDVNIGANALIIEHKDIDGKTYKFLIDDGSKLTQNDKIYDGICPDIRDELKNIDAIFLTHTHNDHDNGLQTLEMLDYKLPPIYGSANSINAYHLKRSLAGLGAETTPETKIIKAGEPIHFNNGVEVEAFDTSHSALGSMGFHFLTKLDGKENVGLVFLGDFNLRELQAKKLNGEKLGFDKEKYKDLISRKKTTHVFMDSTSTSSKDEYIFDKETCIQSWEELFKEAAQQHKKQIFTSVISGSGEHLIKLAEAIRRHNEKTGEQKKLFIDSPNLNVSIIAAEKAGIDTYEDVIFSGKANDFTEKTDPKDRVIVLSGAFADGSEETSASKAATGKSGVVKLSEQEKNQKDNKDSLTGHPFFKITDSDVFVQAQRDVGINSKGITKTIHRLAALGVTIYQVEAPENSKIGTYSAKKFQSSGHAGKSETIEFINFHNKGTLIIPIHGDMEQLDTTANIAQDEGYKNLVFENADQIMLTPTNAVLLGHNEQDKTTYLAFRREPSLSPAERTTVIDQVQVYPDHENPNKEHIVFMNEVGKHDIVILKGKWVSREAFKQEKEERKQAKPFAPRRGRETR
ncbi:MAG: MBL fold metallo-hydrolase [Alphaproteobacteria bacterium]|nr:MBL fold metallo-hydrolase [Alphaproteobacteria bacterium]